MQRQGEDGEGGDSKPPSRRRNFQPRNEEVRFVWSDRTIERSSLCIIMWFSWVQGDGEERGEDRQPNRRRNYRTRMYRRRPPGEGGEQQPQGDAQGDAQGEDAPVSFVRPVSMLTSIRMVL